MTDIYNRLAKYLDSLPAGYPPTKSGVELRILKKLFSEEEASIALHLTLIGAEAKTIARRAELEPNTVSEILDKMVRKGLISGSYPDNAPPTYTISQFVVGFYEGQVNRLDAELIEMVEDYGPYYFQNGPWKKLPQIRTIPINEAIPITSDVMPYMQAEAILRAKEWIAVRNCICRQEREMLGLGCGKPIETCLSFNDAARDTVKTGKGRMVSLDEALEILKSAEKAGLVLQPSNSKDPIYLCMCCSCCCGVLRHIKDEPKPSELVGNPYIASYDPEPCITCGDCVEICPMEALTIRNDEIYFESIRCIGCGLCVSVCPTGAVSLVEKPKPQQPKIPKNTANTYIKIAWLRGIGKLLILVKMFLENKVNRVH